jgi:hypothetical protein
LQRYESGARKHVLFLVFTSPPPWPMVSENECKTFTVGVTHFVRPPSQIWDSLGLALEGRRRQPRRACTSVWFWSSLNEDTFYQLRISQRFVKTQGKPLTKSSTVPSVVSGLGMYFVLRYVDRVAFPMVPCLISTPPTKIWAYRPSSASTRRLDGIFLGLVIGSVEQVFYYWTPKPILSQ